MNRVAVALDALLAVIKWPVGIAALLLLPAVGWASIKLGWGVIQDPLPLLSFGIGAVVYYGAWRLFFRQPGVPSFFSTLEHELTHALFAVLTFHRVTGIRASWRDGGVMSYIGRGNFLITISPYFFPTASAVLMALFWLFPASWLAVASAVLGATACYHFTSTWTETHVGQSDLQKVSFVYALMFLPATNLASYGAIVAFAHGGGRAVGSYFAAIGHYVGVGLGWLG